jgi:transposase
LTGCWVKGHFGSTWVTLGQRSIWVNFVIPFKPYINCIINQFKLMSQSHTRGYHRVGEDKRIHLIALYEQNYTMVQISRQTKVALGTVKDIIRKWKQYHTVRDLPRTGRPAAVDDRTRRRLARIIQKGEVSTATELTRTVSALGVARVSAATVRSELHSAGLKAMHACRKPLLTFTHKKKG